MHVAMMVAAAPSSASFVFDGHLYLVCTGCDDHVAGEQRTVIFDHG